LNLDTLNDF